MSIFGTHDPFVVPIGIRFMRLLPRIEKLAGVKNPEIFRERMMELVDRAYGMASSNPTLLKKTKRIVVRELKEALDGNDVREVRIQAEELHRLDETLYRLELEEKKDRRPGKWKETIRKQFVNDLLDAVEVAGGRLGLDRSNGRGRLDKAIKLLRPCLPNDEFRRGLSIATLKKIKAERAKKLQKVV
jgi:hypothetical protein